MNQGNFTGNLDFSPSRWRSVRVFNAFEKQMTGPRRIRFRPTPTDKNVPVVDSWACQVITVYGNYGPPSTWTYDVVRIADGATFGGTGNQQGISGLIQARVRETHWPMEPAPVTSNGVLLKVGSNDYVVLVNETPADNTVTLVNDGGSAGNKTTACSFTYTATSMRGFVWGTGLSPLNSRARILNAPTTAATKGTVRWAANGDLQLWDCNETLAQNNCA